MECTNKDKEVLDLCKSLIRIDSTTGNEKEIVEFIGELLRDNKIEFQKIKVSEGRWDIFAKKGKCSKGILFCGHCDTVPKTKEWTNNPFDPFIKNGKLFGLGSSDMKCGLGAIINSFISDKSDNLNGLLVTVGEEGRAFDGIKKFVETDLTKEFDFAIVADSSNFDVCVEQSGLAGIDITVEGTQRHTQSFEEGINPIHEAVKLIDKLNKEFTKIKETKVSDLGNEPILSVNKIHSGEKTNVIPEKCVISIDRRVSPKENLREVEKFFEKNLKKFDNVTWKKRTWLESSKREENDVVKLIKKLGASINRKIDSISSIGVSEMAFLRACGLGAVTFGPGQKKNAHTKDEFILVNDVLDYARLIGLVMNRGNLGGMKK